MSRRILVTFLMLDLVTLPASAQLVVTDPDNLAHTVLIAQRAQQVYDQLHAEYQLIVRMAQGLGNLERYRIPPIAITGLPVPHVAIHAVGMPAMLRLFRYSENSRGLLMYGAPSTSNGVSVPRPTETFVPSTIATPV